MKRVAVFVYGVACYLIGMGTLAWSVAFLGNLGVPTSIDSPPRSPLARAILIDTLLVLVFAAQHTVMARKGFKRAWNRLLPEAAGRSTYVLMASLSLMALFLLWEPVGGVVWSIRNPAARFVLGALATTGAVLLLVTTFLINHFDLFGVRQVYLYLRGRPYTQLLFRTPLFYRHVRHPLYLGFLLAYWATPVLTGSRLLFGVLTTAYLMIGVRLEEQDLIRIHGEAYRTYRASVPMVLPSPVRRRRPTPS